MFGAELQMSGNGFMTACFRPLVTSFTGKYGSIQYYVKATLERPAAPDQSVQTELQVISHIDVSSPALLVRGSWTPPPPFKASCKKIISKKHSHPSITISMLFWSVIF